MFDPRCLAIALASSLTLASAVAWAGSGLLPLGLIGLFRRQRWS